ncbi:hypothetical protein LSTR_LSTR016962 [Laodelphax striatellus]|uniref:ZP domain-containing protein n=1 Tax=Laodelphax striatellus TaxID=195883 RepID=A0A482XNQ0_LAOST|nr:hypothetical protein LSTR_LSTR016962 [Laodelphax striatellus]
MRKRNKTKRIGSNQYKEVSGQTTLVEQDFLPVVTATCKAGFMTIKVSTNSSFLGAIHARDFRTSCIAYGNGTNLTTLDINMLASQGSPDYCGVLVNNRSGNSTFLLESSL